MKSAKVGNVSAQPLVYTELASSGQCTLKYLPQAYSNQCGTELNAQHDIPTEALDKNEKGIKF